VVLSYLSRLSKTSFSSVPAISPKATLLAHRDPEEKQAEKVGNEFNDQEFCNELLLAQK